jgi:phospholipid/cholesterol/gamma-HCH transport system permease protein
VLPLRWASLHWLDATLTFIGEATLMLGEACKRIWRPPFELGELINQMAFVGAASVPIVALTCFSSGAVIALYMSRVLLRYGAASLAGGTIGLSVVRELAPVLSGIMVSARCGSAMSAQIGTMAVTEQVDALRALDVHPINYLVIPRILASVTMLPVLCAVGMYAGTAGGYIVSVYVSGISSGTFWSSFKSFMDLSDLWGGLLKTVAFGFIISVVACTFGLRTKGGAVGVGSTTTRTVVTSMVLVYVADYFLTSALFAK